MEIWKPIPGWGTRYEASSYGRIRSLDMECGAKGGSVAVRKGRVLSLARKGNGYLAVTLTDGITRKQYLIHDLVMMAFKGEKPVGMVVCHSDDNKDNNFVENLRYDTKMSNEHDAMRNGRKPKGSRHAMSKLSEEDVRTIRASSRKGVDLAQEYGVSAEHIYVVRSRKVWKHLA